MLNFSIEYHTKVNFPRSVIGYFAQKIILNWANNHCFIHRKLKNMCVLKTNKRKQNHGLLLPYLSSLIITCSDITSTAIVFLLLE